MERRPARHRPRASRPLPTPTPSEAAFERLLAEFDEVSATGEPVDAAGAFVERLFADRKKFLERDRFASIGDASGFNTKVVGVSFEGRQSRLTTVRSGDRLELVRQPDNPKDPNAIAIVFGALQLGFVRRQIAARIAPQIDSGERYTARVLDVTGGGDGKHVGLNVYVERVREVERERAAPDRAAADDRAIQRALIGDRVIRESQAAVLERLRAGRKTLAILGTGRGKSFCFQLPAALGALEQARKTLVFYPLRALANDQFETLRRRLAEFGLRIMRANGSVDGGERRELEAALASGTWDIALATPEFAQHHADAFAAAINRPSLVVVDEAHHLFESRHRPAYGTLGAFIERIGSPQVLALTATAGDEAFAAIREQLGIEAWVIDPTIRSNLSVVDARETKEKVAYIRRALDADGKAIVYCNSRSEATKVAERLRAAIGDRVSFYHAGIPTPDRATIEQLFRDGELSVIVATSAFGEGIDLPDVRDVFLYHLNFDFTEFNQQAGRAGRDGRDARIHLLYGESDRRINDYIISKSAPAIATLRELYRGMHGLTADETVRMTYEDIASTLAIERVDGSTVGAAVRIFEEAGLVDAGIDDDGRYVRFKPVTGRVDLTATTRYADGEAERDSFDRFCRLALGADAATLEQVVNRPIFPTGVPLRR